VARCAKALPAQRATVTFLPAAAAAAGTRDDVDALAADGPAHGWTLLFADKHPYAGGPEHYAAYLAGTDGFEVELVAAD